jgi:ElaB/YqjD/DUF883 family membrane-anchored ribosome-binding protein
MKSNGSNHISSGKSRLIADVHTVLADVEELLQATANQGGDKVAAIRAKVTDSLSEAKEKLLVAEQRVVDKGKAAVKATDQYVHENPWQSALIAGGVGFVIGFIVTKMASSSKS